MDDCDIDCVMNLADESERLYEVMEPHSAGLKDLADVAGWNGEKVCFAKKNIRTSSVTIKRRFLSRRKSSTVPQTKDLVPQTVRKEIVPSRDEHIKDKKLPNVAPKAIIPKFHFVQAPFQLNYSLNGIIAPKDLNNFSCRVIGNDSPGKYLRRSIHTDIIKKPEFLNDYTLLKPMHKNFELALEHVRNMKLKRHNKPQSAFE